ncbi:hypothetical protein AtubIFM54640_005622 [Aspergillus tubingensis]|nr:hypothetical protein AtubIFM54640_005622 [Aspergillus tubingensis]
MRREDRWDVQKELVKKLAHVTTQLLPAGKGVGLRFVNCEVDIFPNLAVDQVKKILDSAPLSPGGNAAIGRNLSSRVLGPLVYSKISSQRLDRPLLIIITIGGYPESRAESALVNAIIECGRKLELAGYPRRRFEVIDPTEDIEEETLPTYNVKTYYPVRLEEILDGRYQVVAKLGYGVTSTVWLGRDLSDSKHVALKIYVSGTMKSSNQIAVYERINTVETDHAGNVDQFLYFFPGRVMNLDALKPCLRQVLGIVDFLHTEAKVIHTGKVLHIQSYIPSITGHYADLQSKNLLLPGDPKNFSGLEDAEIEAPSPRKILGPERTIYTSHIVIPGNGLPLLSDFGEARFSDEEHDEDIMPNIYRAPEVVLKMNWDSKVDVWSIALMAWDIVCSKTLFDGRNSDGVFDDRVHLAEMIAIMGPPPADFIKRSKVGSVFWDEEGKWKDLAPVSNMTLEERAADIQGPDKEAFLKLMRRALTWDPKDRPAAGELIFDEWLMKGLQLPAHLSKET